MVLTAVHFISLAVTGMMWTYIDLAPKSALKRHFRDIRAVHFGSLYLIPMFLGLAWAFERLQVPAIHQAAFPVGLGLLVLFSSIGYLFPLPEHVEPFYYWTKGWPLVLAMIGLVCLVVALFWTAAVLTIYSLRLS
jgi:peptidoglycan/LPS O-acetylase OafA/YrhL